MESAKGGLRGVQGVRNGQGDDTRDPDLKSFLGGEGRALIEQWQRRALALTSDRDVMRDDRVKARVLTECANELEALLTVSGAAQWQPIETAPKDGTWILTFDMHDDGRQVILRWDTDSECKSPYWRDGELFRHEPTHWMPLRDPLAVSGAAHQEANEHVRFERMRLLAADYVRAEKAEADVLRLGAEIARLTKEIEVNRGVF